MSGEGSPLRQVAGQQLDVLPENYESEMVFSQIMLSPLTETVYLT